MRTTDTGRDSSAAKITSAAICAVAIHIGLVALLMTRFASSGLVIVDKGDGDAIEVTLTHPPKTVSPEGRTSDQASELAPPHSPALAFSALDPDATPTTDRALRASPTPADPFSPSLTTDPTANALAMRSRLGLLTAPVQPASSNPWTQASFRPQTAAPLVLDLWPEVAACWQGRSAAQPIRLRLTLDPFGALLSSDLLQDDDSDKPPADQDLVSAKAAVAACSPYVERGDATTFEVIFPSARRTSPARASTGTIDKPA